MKLPRNALIAFVLLGAVLVCGSPAHAQDTLSAGELLRSRHMRIAAPSVAPGWLTGHLIDMDSTVFTFQTLRAEPWRIPRNQVTAIQIGVGRGRTEGALLGMGIGALVGGGVLLAWELLVHGQGGYFGLVALVFGVPVGGLSGGVVGALQSGLEWVDVEVGPAP